jgi:protein-S-isoprenylcysteine O-methyltransferase Ste14
MKTSTRFASVVLGTVVYLALAVLGEGGIGPFVTDPALGALVVVFLVMMVAAWFAGGSLSAGVREDRGNRWVIAALTAVGLLNGWLPAYCDRLGFWVIDGEAVRWLGVAVVVVGGALRLWPVYVLGHRFSGLVAIQPGHALLTDGIYRVIRHPSYLGLILSTLGWGLAFRAWLGVLLAIVTALIVLARIRAEEALLHSHFGAAYDAFRARTRWRLFPGLY